MLDNSNNVRVTKKITRSGEEGRVCVPWVDDREGRPAIIFYQETHKELNRTLIKNRRFGGEGVASISYIMTEITKRVFPKLYEKCETYVKKGRENRTFKEIVHLVYNRGYKVVQYGFNGTKMPAESWELWKTKATAEEEDLGKSLVAMALREYSIRNPKC